MKRIVTVFLWGSTLLLSQTYGQNFRQQFNDLVSKEDTVGRQLTSEVGKIKK